MIRLKFRYVNWRGEDHEYVINPEGIAISSKHPKHWELNGDVVTRDGQVRKELGGNRRRSFKLTEIRDLTEVE